MLRLTVCQNCTGPKVFFKGGNLGDEYGGQIALIKLANELKAQDIQ